MLNARNLLVVQLLVALAGAAVITFLLAEQGTTVVHILGAARP
jgi:hypothetical protein